MLCFLLYFLENFRFYLLVVYLSFYYRLSCLGLGLVHMDGWHRRVSACAMCALSGLHSSQFNCAMKSLGRETSSFSLLGYMKFSTLQHFISLYRNVGPASTMLFMQRRSGFYHQLPKCQPILLLFITIN